ncbi:MAG: LamB/YcsF family protein [Haemophilus parainfluenzae]
MLSSANIACGLHAGGAKEMQSAVRLMKENQVRIGAHPGFPDRDNLGRIQMDLPAARISCTFTLSAWRLKSNL